MPDFLPVALLALAPGDSLPVPLIAVDGQQVAYTVQDYMDTTVTAWRILGDADFGGVIQVPEGDEVLVAFIPPAGEDQSTGVAELPPNAPPSPHRGEPGTGCGRLLPFSIEWR